MQAYAAPDNSILILVNMRHFSVFLSTCLFTLAIVIVPNASTLAAGQAEQAQLDHFNTVLRSKVETVAILDGEDGAVSGLYTFRNKSSLNIVKFGGRNSLGNPKAIGETGLKWTPLLGAHLGYSESKNEFTDIPWLAGNTDTYTSYALGLEAGARIFLTDHVSVAPVLGIIYSQTNSSFSAGTPAGSEMKRIYGGQLVDWWVDTLSLVPSMELQYQRIFAENWKLTLTTNYAWFWTNDIARTSIYQKISGNSSYWDNRADLDIRLPWKLFGFPLHTGGFVSAAILGDDLREGLDSDAIYIFNGRFGVGDLKGLCKLGRIGMGASYIRANNFYGFSWGLDISF
ncbi:MAG: hypothetical protein ABFD50_08590 [Smithella sp.]